MLKTTLPLSFIALLTGCMRPTPTSDVLGTGEPAWPASLESNLKHLSDLDVYARNDISAACSDVEGRMGAGGNIRLLHFLANGTSLPDMVVDRDGNLNQDTDGSSVFAGGVFSLMHGSVGLDQGPLTAHRGVEAGTSITLSHFATGNLRAPAIYADTNDGSLYGKEEMAASAFPHAQFAQMMVETAASLSQLPFKDAPSLSPADRGFYFDTSGAMNASQVVYFQVDAGHLGTEWLFSLDQADVIILIKGERVDLNEVLMVNAEHHHILIVAPEASELALGGKSTDEAYDYMATILAPSAKTDFFFGRLWGGLYVDSLDANPAKLGLSDDSAVCSDASPGKTSGGQVNHKPF